MSVSLYWSVKPTTGRHLSGSGSRVRDVLVNVFGGFPIMLNNENLAALRAMMIVDRDCLAWSELYNAVTEYGCIELLERY